jgi:hypothetical protein
MTTPSLNLTEALLARHSEALAQKAARIAAESSGKPSDALPQSSDVLPAVSAAPILRAAPPVKATQAVGFHITRLKPYRVQQVLDRTIYEFWKIGGTAKSMHDLRDRANPRMCATITRYRDDTFILAFYPDDGNTQVTKKLPASQLSMAIDDLIGAGFT